MGERGDWQPIETAPKDGTFVLVYEAPDFIDIVHWSRDQDRWEDTDLDWSCERPTHWMPLPSPPPRSGASLPDGGG